MCSCHFVHRHSVYRNLPQYMLLRQESEYRIEGMASLVGHTSRYSSLCNRNHFCFDSLASSSVISPTVIASHWALCQSNRHSDKSLCVCGLSCRTWKRDLAAVYYHQLSKIDNSRYAHGLIWLPVFLWIVSLTALRRDFVRAIQHLRFVMSIRVANFDDQSEISIRFCCTICHVS